MITLSSEILAIYLMRLEKLRGVELAPYLDEALQILLLEKAKTQIGIHV